MIILDNWDIPEAELMDTNLIIPTPIGENEYAKQCVICGKIYWSKGKAPCGACPDCYNDRTCNRCGQPISGDEYESNIDGYCEECQDEEYELHYHDEDWEDYHAREEDENDTW